MVWADGDFGVEEEESGTGDSERDVGEAGRGTADGGGNIEGVVTVERSLNRISTLLRVLSRSERIWEVLDDPSFDCFRVSRSTRAY
jgi:hypothetical protein